MANLTTKYKSPLKGGKTIFFKFFSFIGQQIYKHGLPLDFIFSKGQKAIAGKG